MKKIIMMLSLVIVMLFCLPTTEAKVVTSKAAIEVTTKIDVFWYTYCFHCGTGYASRTKPKDYHCLSCGSWWTICMSTYVSD